jgi:hypothetical protein
MNENLVLSSVTDVGFSHFAVWTCSAGAALFLRRPHPMFAAAAASVAIEASAAARSYFAMRSNEMASMKEANRRKSDEYGAA